MISERACFNSLQKDKCFLLGCLSYLIAFDARVGGALQAQGFYAPSWRQKYSKTRKVNGPRDCGVRRDPVVGLSDLHFCGSLSY